MSKRAFDEENCIIVEATVDTPHKRYHCLGADCTAEMHLVIRDNEAHFSAYANTPHSENCPYRQYGKWVRAVIPPGFDIIDFFLDNLNFVPNLALPNAASVKKIHKSPNDEFAYVRSLSSLTKFCLSHSFDTPIDSKYTVGSLCISNANVQSGIVFKRDLKLLVGAITRIDANGHFIFFEIKSKISKYNLQVHISVDYSLAWDLLNKVKKKYPQFPSIMRKVPASILCDCIPENKITSYYNGRTKQTSVSGTLYNLKHIYIL